MNLSALLLLIFSTSGGIPVAKAPEGCAALYDQGLIQIAPGKIPCYCVAKAGYEKMVRL
jgi:hypothetical protein